jgi:hypothetical protein
MLCLAAILLVALREYGESLCELAVLTIAIAITITITITTSSILALTLSSGEEGLAVQPLPNSGFPQLPSTPARRPCSLVQTRSPNHVQEKVSHPRPATHLTHQ